MNTSKAIEIFEDLYNDELMYSSRYEGNEEYEIKRAEMKEIIELLERGEKFEKMWEEIYVLHGNTVVDDIASLTDAMEILEKKYFPEEVNK